MFIHDCTDMDRYHGCPTLPCTPPGHHWGWFQFDLAKQMVAQAPRYGLTLLGEECRWCQADGCSLAHNCVCVDRGGLAGGGWGSHRRRCSKGVDLLLLSKVAETEKPQRARVASW
jgi:hypothetical protein